MSFQIWPCGDDDLRYQHHTTSNGQRELTSKSTTNPVVNTSKPIKTDFVMNDNTNENAYASAHVVEGIKGTYGQCNEECL